MGFEKNTEMKHVFLFNEKSCAAAYGIGTYISQLSECVSFMKNVKLHIVQLRADVKELIVVKHESCVTYSFPEIQKRGDKMECYYIRNVWYLLNMYIHKLDTHDIIFHLNFFQEHSLVKYIKRDYPNSKVVFTIHYLDWCFVLKGNTNYFKSIINKNKSLLDEKEKRIMSIYEKEKCLFQEVDIIICLSQYTRNLLVADYQIPSNKIRLIYNGLIDRAVLLTKLEKTKLKRSFFIPKQCRIILFVGRLDEIKGVDIAIDAFIQVLKKAPHSHFIIVGDGDFSTYLKKIKNYWYKITFTGRLEKEELYKLYQIADVGIMPSMHEQCSYVAIEMLMFNIPLIISTTTGLNEMHSHDDNKIKVEEKKDEVFMSSDLLSQKILMNIQKTETFNLQYRYIYEHKYTIGVMFQNMKNIYKT